MRSYVRWKYEIVDKTERAKRQHQDNDKENDVAVFEARPACNLDAVKYPIGHEVKACGHQGVVNNFQVNSPLMFHNLFIILRCRPLSS